MWSRSGLGSTWTKRRSKKPVGHQCPVRSRGILQLHVVLTQCCGGGGLSLGMDGGAARHCSSFSRSCSFSVSAVQMAKKCCVLEAFERNRRVLNESVSLQRCGALERPACSLSAINRKRTGVFREDGRLKVCFDKIVAATF